MHKTLKRLPHTDRKRAKIPFAFRSLLLGSESRHSQTSFFSVTCNDVTLFHKWDGIITCSFRSDI